MQDAFVRFLCKQQDEPALVLHYCDLLEFLKTSTRKHFRSKRRQANLSERPDQADTRKYSTAAQMRDVVKYAAERAAETPSQMPQFEETVMLVLARDVVGFTSEELGSITGKSFGYANTRISRLHNTLKNNQALR